MCDWLFCLGRKRWPRPELAPTTNVRYNNLLWMCTLNPLWYGMVNCSVNWHSFYKMTEWFHHISSSEYTFPSSSKMIALPQNVLNCQNRLTVNTLTVNTMTVNTLTVNTVTWGSFLQEVHGVTTLRQMRQMLHTEIDDSFKSELLGALGGSPNFYLPRYVQRLSEFASFKNEV